MLNRNAYLRTLEVFLAFLTTFIFVIYVMPTYFTGETPTESVNILTPLSDDLRDCKNVNCIESSITNFDPDFIRKYNYKIDMGINSSTIVYTLPRKNIYTDSVYIAGNITNYEPRIIKLYYWER